MPRTKTSLLLAFFLASGVVHYVARAQLADTTPPDQPTTTTAQNTQEDIVPAPKPPFAWAQQEWTDDDKPYVELRKTIDGKIAKTSSRADIKKAYEELRLAALKNPSDPQAQFAWAYAAWRISNIDPLLADPTLKKYDRPDLKLLSKPNLTLRNLSSAPSTYQWARLRFLLEMANFAAPELGVLGQRLLRRNPKDDEIIYPFVKVAPLDTLQQQQQALRYVQLLFQQDPTESKYHALSGHVHFGIYALTGNRVEQTKAIAAYRKFLQIAPPNHPFRNQAQRVIRLIQKM